MAVKIKPLQLDLKNFYLNPLGSKQIGDFFFARFTDSEDKNVEPK